MDETRILKLRRNGGSGFTIALPVHYCRAHNITADTILLWTPEINGVRLTFHQPDKKKENAIENNEISPV